MLGSWLIMKLRPSFPEAEGGHRLAKNVGQGTGSFRFTMPTPLAEVSMASEVQTWGLV